MKAPPIPGDEPQRLAALRRYGLLDTPPEKVFDDLTALAAHVCQTPIALISLVDSERQWFKSSFGPFPAETERSCSFCGHAVFDGQLLVVCDATRDERFTGNPLVAGEQEIRFYASTPLVTYDGYALGTLCVMDRRPREISPQQIEMLCALGRQVMNQMELRLRISEQERIEKQLAESAELRRAILDSANYSIISCRPDGIIRAMNAAAERWLGTRNEDVEGKQTPEIFHDPCEIERRSTELAGELGRPIPPGFSALVAKAELGVTDEREWTYITAQGHRFPVLLSTTSLRSTTGEITGFLFIASDITERKEVELAKNEFVSVVSHELRTPLTSIRGSLGLIEGGAVGEVPPKMVRLVEIARANTDRLVRLINDILDLAKIEAGKLELQMLPLDPAELVAEAVAEINGMADQFRVRLAWHSDPSWIDHRPSLLGDRDRLLQVLINLLSNAIKVSPPDSVVETRVEAAGGASVRISVRDQGPGIPAHELGRIFGKFQQIDSSDTRARGGTGLGLAISKAIVDEHGGTIGIETEEHKGSTFWFEIPLPRDEWALAPDNAGLQLWRVLVVAGPGMPPAVAADLASCGFHLERAGTLAEARARLTEAPPDALLLDPLLAGARDLRADLHRDPRTAWLPVIQRPADLAQLRGALQRAVRPPGEPRVLLVDAGTGARQALIEMLRSEGLEPMPANDGGSALEIARRRPPDLIILDAELPGMNGQALVQELRHSRLCATPLLVYTSHDLSAEEHRLLRLGPTSFLVKGRATERELLGTILELLGDVGAVR